MTLNKIYLKYNPKDNGTFHLARWRKDYSPDLSMITQDPECDDITITRHISNGFPRNQHHPVFLHYGKKTPLTRTIPKHRLLEPIGMDSPDIWTTLSSLFQLSLVHMTDSRK
jgi:hypothetical protein